MGKPLLKKKKENNKKKEPITFLSLVWKYWLLGEYSSGNILLITLLWYTYVIRTSEKKPVQLDHLIVNKFWLWEPPTAGTKLFLSVAVDFIG